MVVDDRMDGDEFLEASHHEAVYLHDLADGFQARRVIGEWVDF